MPDDAVLLKEFGTQKGWRIRLSKVKKLLNPRQLADQQAAG